MCGFSAYFHFDSSLGQSFNLDASLEQIIHRGPDSKGKYISDCGQCGLGHVRLSINDLDGGQQPISDVTESIHTVVSGELYDFERIRKKCESKGYMFKTKSDSEIIIPLYQEYGLSFLEHLRGEFAFCMYDVKQKKFMAVRDRFGIKPAYYTVQNGTLLVASEMKAFLPMGWKPEWDMSSIVNNGSLLNYRTCFKNVYKIPPAHYLVADPSGFIEIRPYWCPDYPDKNVKDTRSVDEMVKGVHDRLEEAIRLRLQADVPVGFYLSGGIDSSCIVGMASKILKEKNPNARLKTFCIAFNGGESLDESQIAERTSKFIGVDFEKLEVSQKDMMESLEDCVWHAEVPLLNMSCVARYLLSRFARDKGYKTVISGEGSDEHFAGYAFLRQDFLLEPDHSVPNEFDKASDRLRKKIFQRLVSRGHEVSSSASAEFGKKNVSDKIIRKVSCLKMVVFTDQVINTFGLPDYFSTTVEVLDGVTRAKCNKKWHPLHASLCIHSRIFLGNALCGPMGDRSEMAHSVEGRCPFLDHPLCEYVNSLPPSVKIKIEKDGSLNEKWILKQAMKPYVTEEIYKRNKQPFLAPSPKEITPEIIEFMRKWITKENVDRLGWARFDLVIAIKDEYFKTLDWTLFDDLMKLICYIMISRQFNVTKYSPLSRV
ncbi:hypothetical protein G6F56_007033 [Rhizopus delemar]|nr:hypothetical protein G6F56_007033 [Rhizopus delemar]